MSADEPRETELKLSLDPADAERLMASPLLREHAVGPLRSEDLVSTYYDTPDQRLAGRRVALRVRRIGERSIQTLKTASRSEGPVKDRGEWEVALPTPAVDLRAFADPCIGELTGLVLPEELAPVFETRIQRQTLPVRWREGEGTALVEVACDLGTIAAGGHELPVAEVELELKEGSARALFDLARAMRALVPLRLGTRDKAERGYGLANGTPPPWRRASRPELDRSLKLEEGLGRILASCVAHALQNEAAAADGRQPEGVHQFRVALRQLRSAFSLFEAALPAGDVARWTGEIRWLVGCLGRTRDLDVLTNELLAPLLAERPRDEGLQALREAALAKREAEQVAVREALASPRAGDLLFELAVWVELHGWRTAAGDEALREQRRPLRKRAVKILERCHRRVLKRGRGFAGLDAEGRHALRIAVKKLRYGIEFFETLFPAKRLQPYLAIVRRMQGQLGHLNDVVVAERLVRGLLAGPAAPGASAVAALAGGELIGWHAHAVRTMEPAIVRAWDEFRTLEPFWRRGGRGR